MATKSDKPQVPAPTRPAGRLPDYAFDPVPLPEVVESDSDTAWGRWEDTLKATEDHGATRPAQFPATGFSETLPSSLAAMPDTNDTEGRS